MKYYFGFRFINEYGHLDLNNNIQKYRSKKQAQDILN